ncbi:RHS repeat-associated core domain-containing protein [Streptomyces sp. NPDC020719]|uniref:RHS repeat-associated core domain-containing protein n=1 Tax=Streptomyces sp. NPDC020719 TaxID=3154896 RepID=UPI00340F4594
MVKSRGGYFSLFFGWIRRTGRPRDTVALAACFALVLTLLSGAPVLAQGHHQPKHWSPRPLEKAHSVPGQDIEPQSASKSAKTSASGGAAAAKYRPLSVTWPKATHVQVDPGSDHIAPPLAPAQRSASRVPYAEPGPAHAAGTPVWVGRPGALTARRTDSATAAHTPARVTVAVAAHSAAQRAGVDGALFSVADAAAGGEGKVSVGLDYTGFADAYGGDYATRLQLVQLPACAMTAPQSAGCRTAKPIGFHNDFANHRLVADVTLPGAARTTRSTAQPLVLAATAAPGGAGGTYAATGLAPSGSWSAGTSSGDFTWTYPISVPPPLGGSAPAVALSYDSSSIDGRTAATNNQPSWIGDGWDYQPGSIERSYKPCSKDGEPNTVGDNCWVTDNATMSLGGRTVKLVKDDTTGTWRESSDDGSRVDHLTGASNGAQNGEYWRVTTTNGTQYYFGLNHAPGSTTTAATNSTWTAPVFGNNTGEPCHGSTYDTSWCQQAWHWSLDFVIDPNQNITTYSYKTESNYYARGTTNTLTSYIRGGYLATIGYGQLVADAVAGNKPAAQIVFTTAERCIPDASFTCASNLLTTANAAHWPDVPFDQSCASTGTCSNHAPSFWSTKRLTTITTQVLVGTAYSTADTYDLTHQFPANGDTNKPGLWLASITHTGNDGGTLKLPAVTFYGTRLANRVDTTTDNIPPINRYRVRAIATESGGQINITYKSPECVKGTTMPASPDSNTMACYPVYWVPQGASDPTLDWFQKYLVEQVTEVDNSTLGAATKSTSYEYAGGAAWHHDDEELMDLKNRTWGQFRGYGEVITRTGTAPQTLTQSSAIYMRGMNGDVKADGTKKSVTVTDSAGGSLTDDDQLAGLVRESRTYDTSGGSVQAATFNTPWEGRITATHKRTGLPDLNARLSGTSMVQQRAQRADKTWRTTETDTSYNSDGLVTAVDDKGDGTATTPEVCTKTSYAQSANPGATNMVAFPSEVIKIAGSCDATPTADNTLSDNRSFYDNKPFGMILGTADTTSTQVLDHYDGSGAAQFKTAGTTTYDSYGRATSVTNALGAKTSTAYSPATGALPTAATSTQPAVAPATTGWQSTTTYDPLRAAPLTTTDMNGRITDVGYDPLGRLASVWLPGRKKASQSPSKRFTYALNKGTPSVVTSETLREDESYTLDYKLYDGLLRLRQEQQSSGDGGTGRLVSDTFYDTHGWEVKSNAPYYNTTDPATSLFVVSDDQVPAQVGTFYDGMGRPVAKTLSSLAVEQWRSTTAYPGVGEVDVTPPPGSSATATITDARGRTVELRQYHGSAPTGDYDTTRYHYNAAGNRDQVTDGAGNTWSTGYDIRGRKSSATDPDTGTTTYTYDDLDQVSSVTDARHKTLAFTYDELGRKTAEFAGSTTGTKLASWAYDTLAKGKPTSSTRYSNGNAYTNAVTGYDVAYRPTGSSVTIPSSEGKLAGTYTTGATYTPNTGLLYVTSMPAAGGLPAEDVGYAYNIGGKPLLVGGKSDYISDMAYTPYGQVQRSTVGDVPKQVSQTNSFDLATGRVLKSTLDKENGTTPVDATSYTYTPSGAVTSVSDAQDSGQTDTQCFGYDYLNRLTEAWTDKGGTATEAAPKVPGIGGCVNTTPSATSLGGPNPYWQSYGYDLTGNRTSQTDHDVTGDATKDVTRTQSYPSAGQSHPHAVQSLKTTSASSGTSTDTFAYDEAGNTTAHTTGAGTQNFTWTDEGKLDTVTRTQTSTGTDFVYDADGNQLLRHDPTTSTLYLPGTEVVLNKDANTTSATRYYGLPGALTVARTSDGRLTYLASDPHGTDNVAVDSATLTVQRRPTTPFGQNRSGPTPATWPGDKGFVGGTTDTDTGLTNLGAREYDPNLGRFLSVDPVFDGGDPQALNGYAYADNSPLTNTDPTGLSACDFNPEICHRETTPETKSEDAYAAYTQQTGIVYNYDTSPPPPKKPKHHHWWQKVWDKVETVAVVVVITVVVVAVVSACLTPAGVACAGVVMAAGEGFAAGAELGASAAVAGAVISAGGEALAAVGAGAAVVAGAARVAKGVSKAVSKSGAEGEAGVAASRAEGAAASRAPEPGGCNSFPAATTVLLASGAAVPIDQVKVGDTVEATDPLTNTTKPEKVTHVDVTLTDKDFTDTTVRTSAGDETITSTQHHPYWDATRKQWVDAANLKRGEQLREPDGTLLTVVKIRNYRRAVTTYNLTVEHIHTYYVVAGSTPILVHNCNEVAVDTNAVTDALSGAKTSEVDAALSGRAPVLSPTAHRELLEGGHSADAIGSWLSERGGRMGPASTSDGVASLQARLMSMWKGKSFNPMIADDDASVLHSAVQDGLSIITNDKRFYKNIDRLGYSSERY